MTCINDCFCLGSICCRNNVVLLTPIVPPFLLLSGTVAEWMKKWLFSRVWEHFSHPPKSLSITGIWETTALSEFLLVVIKETLDKYLISFSKFSQDRTSWALWQCKFWSCKRNIYCPLTNLGNWGLGKSFHISLRSQPFQIEQSRFLLSDPSCTCKLPIHLHRYFKTALDLWV